MGIFKLKGWFGMWRVCGKQMHSLSFCLAGPPGIQVALTMFCYCVFLSVFSFYSQTPFSSLTLWLSWGLSFALGPWAGLELPVATGESKMRVLAWDLLPGVTWPQDTWLSSWREQGQVSEVSPRAGIICQFLDLAFFFFLIEVWLIYKVVLVSGVIQLHVYILQIIFPYMLSQNIKHSSLCHTVGPCWLYISYI